MVALWALTFFIMTLLICGPNLSSLWIPGGSAKCRLVYPYQMGTTISDFLLDVFILCLPIPKVSRIARSAAPIANVADLVSTHDYQTKDCNLGGVLSCLGVRSARYERSNPELIVSSGVGASAARMALCIHLVTVGRPVNDEDSYRESLHPCSSRSSGQCCSSRS